MKPYTTQNSLEFGFHAKSWIGPSLSAFAKSMKSNINEALELTEHNSAIKVARSAEKVELRLSIIALVALIDLCLSH
jgi:hypothetical protein